MRLLTVAGLLFSVSCVVAQEQNLDFSSIINQLTNPTEECQTEVKKYQECVNGKSSMVKDGTKEEIQAFCNSFDQTTCKDFFNDINKSESACLNTKEPNIADIVSNLDFFAAKLGYQIYCAKGKDEKLCPLSQYIVDNADKLESKDQTLTVDQLKIIASDCRDDNCQARLISLKETSDNIMTIIANIGESGAQMAGQMTGSFLPSNATSAIFDKYYPSFKEKKCESIVNSKDGVNNSSDANTLKKITFTFVTMMLLSAVMLF